MGFIVGLGCEDPRLIEQKRQSDIGGIKLSDLQAEQHTQTESMLRFSILMYGIDMKSLDALGEVFEILSTKNIRFGDQQAFETNGFAIGFGNHRKGSQVAQKLSAIGAVRLGRYNMSFPEDVYEILYALDVTEPTSVIYSTSTAGLGGTTLNPGKVGWVISAQKDSSARGLAHVKLDPAFWDPRGSNLRLLQGKEPFVFHFFDIGHLSVPLEAGQFCLLGPIQLIGEQDTLNRLLFEVTEHNKVRFFVIICESVENDGH